MGVDEAGEDHVVLQLNNFLCQIAGKEFLPRADLQNLAAIHGHSRFGAVTDTLPFHGVKVGGTH